MYEKKSENHILFNNGVFPVIISDFQNESILKVNKVFTEWFRHTDPDISIISISGDRFKVLEELRNNGICENFPLTVAHKNGKKIPCLATASIAINKSKTEEILIIIHESLENKIETDKLRAKSANLYTLSENIETMFWSVDSQLHLVNFNSNFQKKFHEAYGYSLSIGDNVIEKQPEQLKNTWNKRYEIALSGEKAKYIDKILGSTLETTFIPIFSENHDIIGVCCTVNNISEKINTEKHLQVTNERLSNIFNSSTDAAIITTDPQGIIRRFNGGASQMLRHKQDEVIGKMNILKLFSETFIRELIIFIKNRTGEKITKSDVFSYLSNHPELINQKEWFFSDAENRAIDIKISISSVLMNNQGFAGLLIIAQDISELNRIKEQLVDAKIQAEEISRTKTSFLANMSHEIRTPLNGIIGMADLLIGTELTPVQNNYSTIVQKSAHSLLLLINDILDYSKIEAGKLSLDLISFNLRNLMDDIQDILLINIKERNIDFKIQIDPSVSENFIGDPGRIKQILLNLIGNALKFTMEGFIAIEIYQVGEAGRDITLYFKVIDSGIGISNEEKEKLFQSFSQVDISTTRKYGGTGLGLAISRKLVSMMDGEIGVLSKKDKGSTFWFTINLNKELREFSNKKILLVNSNKISRQVLAGNLKKLKFRLSLAENSEQCMEELRLSREKGLSYDLIIIDKQLKDSSGEELAHKIKELSYYKDVKLILTSYERDFDSTCFISLIQLPVNQKSMVIALEAICDHEFSVLDRQDLENVEDLSFNEVQKKQIKVLVAEDNKINQLVAIKFLKKLGYEADLVENGREAVEACNKKYYDLILMDHMMPVMDGIEATREIRKKGSQVSNKNILIIALTANAMKGDREMLLDSGMDDYISKPVLLKEMKAVLEKNLNKNR